MHPVVCHLPARWGRNLAVNCRAAVCTTAARWEWLASNWNSLDGTLDPLVLLLSLTISLFAIGERNYGDADGFQSFKSCYSCMPMLESDHSTVPSDAQLQPLPLPPSLAILLRRCWCAAGCSNGQQVCPCQPTSVPCGEPCSSDQPLMNQSPHTST